MEGLSVSARVAAEDRCKHRMGAWSTKNEKAASVAGMQDRLKSVAAAISHVLLAAGLRVAEDGKGEVQVEVYCSDDHVAGKIVGNGSLLDHAPRASCAAWPSEAWAECVAGKLANVLLQSPNVRAYAATRRAAPAPSPHTVVADTPASAPAPTSPVAAVRPRGLLAGSPQLTAFALVVGIERYREQMPVPAGARGDAERFAEVARATLGIPARNIRLALDDRATKADIEKHLAWLKANVPAGGRVYFYFS
ncbi:MAG TPA: hypothetical protein VGQ83_11865, partial [Polyangia bacterium]